MKRILILFSLLLIIFPNLKAQGMKRKGMIGIMPQELNDSLASVSGLKSTSGIRVARVFPNTTAEKLKLEEGDIIQSINGKVINGFPELRAIGGEFWGGEKVEMTVWRNKKAVQLKGEIVPKPKESWENAEVIYDHFNMGKGKVRTIITRPDKEGKAPVIFLIPGFTCFSIDNLHPIHPYSKLIQGFSDAGFAVMRVEKPGMGDNYNTPDCADVDLDEENQYFAKAYEKMLGYDFVDKNQVFIFGHSMGGITAPVIAAKYQPKGVIVYGTSHEPWVEYLTKMLRFQNVRMGMDYATVDHDMRIYHNLLYEQYVQKVPIDKLVENPEYKRLLERDFQYDGTDKLFGRSNDFWLSVQDQHMTEAWEKVEGKVLSIFGEADFEVMESGPHEAIADIVNAKHPGHATYKMLEGTDHSFIKVGSMEDGVEARNSGQMRQLMQTSFNNEIIEMISNWVDSLN